MTRLISRIRQPVKREGSQDYLLITLVSFAFSVSLTRLFLELTGYPQLGNAELHIAHVLWGGLLLFVASLLPLIFANRWVYTLGACASGVGVGLFIDEVGKFITQSNDYFYPPAAPIIYAFFLITVLLYVQVRRPPSRDARAELYRVLDALEEVLDHDLDPAERADLEGRLRHIASNAEHPNLARLADELLDFLASETLQLVQPAPGLAERARNALQRMEARLINPTRLKGALAGGLIALGLISLPNLEKLLRLSTAPEKLTPIISEMILAGRVASPTGLQWLSARLALEGVVGLILLAAAFLLVAGRDGRGFSLAYLGLLLSLTAANLLGFYFDQFSTILRASVQFVVFLGVLYYRSRFLGPDET